MSFDPDKPFNHLPLLPPKAELETKAVLRKAIAANKTLAELKGAGFDCESGCFDQRDRFAESQTVVRDRKYRDDGR
jgi:hypothetical protein